VISATEGRLSRWARASFCDRFCHQSTLSSNHECES
jgi:hypothetical protein